MKTLLLPLFVLATQVLPAQQRYLVTPRQEVIELGRQKSAAQILKNRLHRPVVQSSSPSAVCGNRFTFGYTEDVFTPSVLHIGFHRDIMGQWFVAPASGTIDTVFWDCGAVNNPANDSILKLRIHNSVIGPAYGPGIRPGPFDPPCQNWGYWADNTDNDQGVAAFPEDANPFPGPFHSTIAHGTAGPPFANEIWGLGGYDAIDHKNSINEVAMLDNGIPCSLTVGQVFFINMRVSAPGHEDDHASGGADWQTWSGRVTNTNENYPSRNWKFYEHDSGPSNCAGVPVTQVKRGWVARGGFGSANDTLDVAALNWWYVMTVTSNTPPQVKDTEIPHNTLSTGPQLVQVDAVDCNPAAPLQAGVTSAWIYYSVNGVDQPRIAMDNPVGTTWQQTIPGQVAGTTIGYFVRAFDSDSLKGTAAPHEYRIVDLTNAYYAIDTASSCSHTSIAATGTDIDTSKFFNDVAGTNPKDDGTAGPYSIPGGAMTIFGDTARYVWIGTNGAIALSKTATDTLDVTASGAYSGSWTFPQSQRNGRADTNHRGSEPGNMIAPFWADLIIGDTAAQYGHIRHGNPVGDPCRWIVEWDSLGTFDANGTIPDNTTFRVILNRCDGTIRLEYDIVGTNGQDSAALVGMQADSNSVTAGYAGAVPGYTFLNRNAYPIETKPTAGHCVTFTPGASLYAKATWNLLSVSTNAVGGNYAKTALYPGSSSAAFKFQAGSYKTETVLSHGRGYWLKYTQPLYAGVPGHHFSSVFDTVSTGWNMIGAPSKSVPVSTGITPHNVTVTSQYFGYNGTQYIIASNITPGSGFWVKGTTSGSPSTLELTAPASLPKEAQPTVETELAQMNRIIIRDAAGGMQTLYLGSESTLKSASLSSFEMPPSMAELTGFDARYSSGRMVETYPSQLTTKAEFPIDITTRAYPILVNWERAKDSPSDLKVGVSGEHGQLFGVIDGSNGTVRITNSGVKRVVITLGGSYNVPKVFALSQNYPNPFNPVTHFSVDVPHTADVEIAVYDLLGQKITTLMTGEQSAGSVSVTWDGRDRTGLSAPSGVYFVRMKSDNFSAVRKIMLMK